MRTLLDLAKELESNIKKIETSASNIASNVSMAVLEDLVFHTPVDTSNALSNWQLTIGAPANNEIEPYYFGRKGSTQSMSQDAAIIAGIKALKSKKPGETIYISNNAPYIKDLDEGSSLQEPAGFVDRALIVGKDVLAKSKLEF